MRMDWASIAVRFALYLDLMLACGLAAFALTAPRRTAAAIPLRGLLVAGGAVGVLASLAGLVVQTAAMAGTSVTSVDRETIAIILTETQAGTAWIARVVALAVALAAALLVRNRPNAGLVVAAIGFAVAVSTLAWGGHGVMNEGAVGWLHLGADIIHLLAAAVWIGSLLGLVLLVAPLKSMADADQIELSWRALHGFATIGTGVVALIVLSGSVNAWLVVGRDGVGTLFSTLYGQLLLAKIAAFVAMVALASLNRFRLTPALRRAAPSGVPHGALAALRLSLVCETTLALLVLALVAWLGTLEPFAGTG
ncbi:MAG: copper resistance protein CopD [Sphingomonadales bacterium]|nr:MAG: copper resistance protein CopD [Sphingomonadales bacterium]